MAKVCDECDASWPRSVTPRHYNFVPWDVLLRILGEKDDSEVSQEIVEAQIPAITPEEKRAAGALCLRCNRGPLQEVEMDGLGLVVTRCWNCHAVWSSQHEPSTYTGIQYEMFLEFLGLASGQEKYSVTVPDVTSKPEA